MKDKIIYNTLYRIILQERFRAGAEVFAALNEEKLPYAVHKGAVLSQVLYGAPNMRISGDIDLLLSREHITRIQDIFKSNGFVQGRVVDDCIEPYSRTEKIYQVSQSHQLAPFVKATTHKLCPFVEYDCNLDVFWGEAQRHTDMNAFLSNTIECELFGIQIRKLTAEAEFIALCMHHYKDLNSIYLLWTRGFDRSKLEEIACYVINVPLHKDLLKSLCQKFGVTDYVCWCIHYANILSPDFRLRELEDNLITSSAQMLFGCLGLNDAERKQWQTPFKKLCNGNTKEYMNDLLTETDRNKIDINLQMM